MKRGPPQPEGPHDRQAAMLELRARRAAARGLEAADFPLVVAPASDRPMRPLPLRRRRIYEGHLRELLRALSAGEQGEGDGAPPEVEVPPELERGLQAGCRACRGHCCHTGGAHAYQNVETLRRVRAARPELTDEALVALYLSHLPARSVKGSCVFHGCRGCTLPRELRGDMCNGYFCRPLLAWRERALDGGSDAGFVLAFDDGLLRGGQFFGGPADGGSAAGSRRGR